MRGTHYLRSVREMQGMRNGTAPRQTIQLVISFKGTSAWVPTDSLPIEPAFNGAIRYVRYVVSTPGDDSLNGDLSPRFLWVTHLPSTLPL